MSGKIGKKVLVAGITEHLAQQTKKGLIEQAKIFLVDNKKTIEETIQDDESIEFITQRYFNNSNSSKNQQRKCLKGLHEYVQGLPKEESKGMFKVTYICRHCGKELKN